MRLHGVIKMKSKTSWATVLLLLFSCFTVQFSQAMLQSSQTISSYGSIVLPNVITYFHCTFSKEDPEGFKLDEPWVLKEPCGYPNELGVWHWVNCDPTGTKMGIIKIVEDPADPGRLCVEFLLDIPGTRPLSFDQHCKLYECQGREPALWGSPYTTLKEAYWKMDYWFPANFQVAENSWRLIFQICGEEGVYGNPNFPQYPQLELVFGDTDFELQNAGFYYTDGIRRDFHIINTVDLPKEGWVTMVIYFRQGSTFRAEDGTVKIWIDGTKVFENHNMSTATYSGTPYVIWGIGNYGGPYEAQGQYIDIKDVTVTSSYPQ